MNLILNVPYNEKDKAKSLGTRWNPELKKWFYSFDTNYSFSNFKSNYISFKKWLGNKETNLIILDQVYICELYSTCYKCHNSMKVILLAADHYFDAQSLTFGKTSFSILFFTESVRNINLINFLKNKFNYFPSYTQTSKKTYFSNHCTRCGGISGDFYLVHNLLNPVSIGGTYWDCIESIEDINKHEMYDANQLNLKKSVTHKIILDEAIELHTNNEFICGSHDILHFSKFKEITV